MFCKNFLLKIILDAYTSKELVYEWQTVDFVEGMILSQFDLISFPYRNFTFKRREGLYQYLMTLTKYVTKVFVYG